MEEFKNDKIERVLAIYTKLLNGKIVNKAQEATAYGVNERSIQRDVDDIRNFLELDIEESGIVNSVVYDRTQKGYRMESVYKAKLTNPEVLAICKILLDSRAFTKNEMSQMLGKLIDCCVPQSNQKLVRELISNEEFHYVEPRHHSIFIDRMWEIGQAVKNCNYIQMEYLRTKDKAVVTRKVKPVAIMFSEYYFYLTAFIDDEEVQKDFDVINDSFPTIYRIDRIKKLKVLDEHFHIPYSSRFEEGEFRKRVQFMYGGKLQKVKFKYSGTDIDAILDRLPTAKILNEENGVYTVSAEVFGKGIDMWLRSQGYVVEKGHFMEVSRTDLIAGYQGQTALKVRDVIEKAKGGVLFIDEAYSITENDHSDSYGRECLTELTKALEDYRKDLVVIVAGYTEPMQKFFDSNPGLKSRFNTFIKFEDYSANELGEMLTNMCLHNDYELSEEVKEQLKDYFNNIVNSKEENFANGRLVRNLYEDLVMNHARRVFEIENPDEADLKIITNKDFVP